VNDRSTVRLVKRKSAARTSWIRRIDLTNGDSLKELQSVRVELALDSGENTSDE